ncbi:MAG TPA: pilus assembly protein PilP [Rhodocyclaceae bacterium]|nr:pilus assembly protein PilP [Rhodocyclaceae bacterium]
MNLRDAVILFGALSLVACSGEKDNITQWMAQQERTMVGGVKPLPEMKPFPVFSYEVAGAVSPFEPNRIVPEARAEVVSGGPDLNRPKEPLEAYPLESLGMVGVLARGNETNALIRVDQALYQIKVGNYLGQNYGVVTDIQETELSLLEMVEDMNGDWVERTSKLLLQEQ